MKNQFILGFAAVIVGVMLFFGFSNKPPKISVFDSYAQKLIDSLDLQNESELIKSQNAMKGASIENQAEIYLTLAQLWNTTGYNSIAADYLRKRADVSPTFENYFTAGSELFLALNTDTSQNMRVNLVYGSRYCFEKALEIKPDDLDANLGLATVIVQGTNQPMEGIQMMKTLDEKYPENAKVNQALGEFSMMSGQYDKAIERFLVVLEKDSLNLRSRYFMVEAYIHLGDTTAAIKLLEDAIPLMQDSSIVERIKDDINNLIKH